MADIRAGLIALAAMAALAAPALGAEAGQDQTGIRDVQIRQQQAWNSHDAHAYAALFTDRADLVNVLGWRWKGRAEIERKLTAMHRTVFKDSVLSLQTPQVQFLTPQIAIALVPWTMTGARGPNGNAPPQRGIQMQTLENHDGAWLIAAFQNTNSVPDPSTAVPPPAASKL